MAAAHPPPNLSFHFYYRNLCSTQAGELTILGRDNWLPPAPTPLLTGSPTKKIKKKKKCSQTLSQFKIHLLRRPSLTIPALPGDIPHPIDQGAGWSPSQIWPVVCFCTACRLIIVFIFVKGYQKRNRKSRRGRKISSSNRDRLWPTEPEIFTTHP